MVQEDRRYAIARYVRKRVLRQDLAHLRSRPDDNSHRLSGIGLQASFKRSLCLRLAPPGSENHIAAGDVGADSLETGCLADRLEVGHGQLASPADIYGPKKDDE